ncbi:hypothetical protein BsIDN1_10890 [Bacillus safensis]|uniref:Uncharacterized protein n=1 Tax=Bacillus safensis TaxID=561879 RepID=A0A5S9M3C1_BACIA|nr:hypothetical protein BsIDN1_10890 [Bacillus safensis]
MARYGIPQGMEYKISEDATLEGTLDKDGKPISLFEQDLVALRVTQQVGFMTLNDDAFAAITHQKELLASNEDKKKVSTHLMSLNEHLKSSTKT